MQQGVFLLLLLLFLCSQSYCEESYFLSNETQHHLNELQYSHEITIREDEAEFTFILHNVTHANESLGITSYFISITFIGEERYEEQLPMVEISSNTSEYHGRLTMMYLEEEEGNYLVCVFFLNPSLVITSSRFCHVVSVANTCQLEVSEGTFNNRHAIILVGGALVLLIIIVIVTQIKSFKNRPRTMADRMKQFPASHTAKLQALGTMVDERRRRRQPFPHELDDHLDEDFEPTVDHDQETDDQYKKYFGERNESFHDDP